MADESAVFLDTSIMIARFVHSPQIKYRIQQRLAEFKLIVTGTVVRQEFRRRLLKEAQYLLKLLDRLHTIEAVQRHVHDVLPPRQDRKRRICLQTLFTVFERDSSEERSERARLFLKSLLRGGLEEFDQLVDHVIGASGCACGRRPIRQKSSSNFDFGTDRCSKATEPCGISGFIADRSVAVAKIQDYLSHPDTAHRSNEMDRTAGFLTLIDQGPSDVAQHDPCLTVGDFLIALESVGIPVMYTMNGRESQHFCRALRQTMIVRKPNPDHEDFICAADNANWPEF
jgi:hypothetical protein